MKRIFTLLALFAFSLNIANAQIADGTVVPNFTLTDLDGNTYDLYEILDQGKPVIIDVFATWCGPCWTYHQGHALKDLYECYGPDGSDNVMIFAVEADDNTTLADLQGTGGSTTGDWLEGATYPFVDDASIGDILQITYYPTVFRICPAEKKIYELGQVSTSGARYHTMNTTCAPPAYDVNPTLTCGKVAKEEACQYSFIEGEVTLINNGANTLNSATLETMVNGAVVSTTNWIGNLAPYEDEVVEMAGFPLFGASEVTYNVAVNTDGDMANNTTTHYVALAPESSMELTLELRTDNKGHETYWEIHNDAGDVVAFGGNTEVGPDGGGAPYINAGNGDGAYDNFETITETIILPAEDCYSFLLVDDFGDGINAASYHRITNEGGEILLEGTTFTDQLDYAFESSASFVEIEEIEDIESVNVFPNPATTDLTVQFNMLTNSKININVYNTLGQVVQMIDTRNYVAGQHQLNLDISNFENGLYFITLSNENQSTTKKFTVNK